MKPRLPEKLSNSITADPVISPNFEARVDFPDAPRPKMTMRFTLKPIREMLAFSESSKLREQPWQRLSCLPQAAFGKRGCVRRLFRSDIDRSGMTSNVSHETGGGLDHA